MKFLTDGRSTAAAILFMVLLAGPVHPANAQDPPVITSPATATVFQWQAYSVADPAYRITASGDPTWFTAEGLPDGLWLAGYTGEVGGQTTLLGEFTVILHAKRNGLSSEPFTLTLNVVSDAPVITSPATATIEQGESYDEDSPAYQITATGTPTWFTATGLPEGMWIAGFSGKIGGIPEAAGTYAVILEAHEGPYVSDPVTLQLTVLANELVITSAAAATAEQWRVYTGADPAYRITASGTPTWFTAEGLPDGLWLAGYTGEIGGQTNLLGEFTVILQATRNGLSSEPFTLTLNVVANAPVITSSGQTTGERNITYTLEEALYRITADQPIVWFDYSGNLPTGLHLDRQNGVIIGNTWETGTFQIEVLAENSRGIQGSLPVAIEIVPDTPFITSDLAATIPQGLPWTYRITATQNPTFYFADGLPPGLRDKLNGETGLLSGTPLEAGTFEVVLSASSDSGTLGSATLLLTVTSGTVAEFTVTNTSGSQTVQNSLPWAVLQASYNSVPSIIRFAIPGTGPHTILLQDDPMFVNEQTSIDATTQPGYDGSPLIHLDVNGFESGFILVNEASLCEISGFQITNFTGNAIATQPGADNNTIRDNWIGFRREGDSWWRNFEAGYGLYPLDEDPYTIAPGIGIQSSGNLILSNVISGVSNGISIGYAFEDVDPAEWGPDNTGNVISGNIIGMTPDGAAILTNTPGALDYIPDLEALKDNPLGTPADWALFGNASDGIYLAAKARETIISDNLCSGNFSVGIELLHGTVSGNVIHSNRIGTDATGTHAMPNGELGIIISNYAHSNTVGGDLGPNLISGNGIAGITLGGVNSFLSGRDNLIKGNHIGVNAALDGLIPNRELGIYLNHPDTSGNRIVGNIVGGSEWGIFLDDCGYTAVEDNHIGVTPDGRDIGNLRDGLVLQYCDGMRVLGNIIRHNGFGPVKGDWGSGLFENGGGGHLISGNVIENNYKASEPYLAGPVVRSAPNTSGTIGEPFSLALEVTEPVETASAGGLPPGLSLDPQTMTISGTPGEGGSFAAEILTGNPHGSHSFVLEIRIHDPGTGGTWIKTTGSRGDWFQSPWLGWFTEPAGGHIHLLGLGFVLAGNDDETALRVFHHASGTWITLNRDLYPFCYIHSGPAEGWRMIRGNRFIAPDGE